MPLKLGAYAACLHDRPPLPGVGPKHGDDRGEGVGHDGEDCS